jgi:hypothetical protein
VAPGPYVRPALAALVVGGAFALAWAVWDATRAEAGLVDPPVVSAALDPVDPAALPAGVGDALDKSLPELPPGALVSAVIEPLPTIVALPPTELLPGAEVPVVAGAGPTANPGHPPNENPVEAAAQDFVHETVTPRAPGPTVPRRARGSGPDLPGPARPDPPPAGERPVAPNPQPALAAVPSSSSTPTGPSAFAVLIGAPLIVAATRWRRTVHERAPPRRVWAFSIDHYG